MKKGISIMRCMMIVGCLIMMTYAGQAIAANQPASRRFMPLQLERIHSPTILEPTGYFTTSHDGISDFIVSPYYFAARPLLSAAFHAEALTNFRIEFYDKNGNFLFYRDALAGGKTTAEGQSYYTVDEQLFESDTQTFYYIMVNMAGANTAIQGSRVSISHGAPSSYLNQPPTQLVPAEDFYWTYDGTEDYSYSPYYFKNNPYSGAANGISAGGKTNFRLEFYDLQDHYLGHSDAVFSTLNTDYPYTVNLPAIPGEPEYYYIILVNMHGEGTTVNGSLIQIRGGSNEK